VLENPRSPAVRAVAKLAKKQRRTEARLFLVEGPQAVREALLTRPELVVDVFITQAAMDRHKDLVSLAAEHQLQLTLATEKVLEEMADTVTPQGVVAVCGFKIPAMLATLFARPMRPVLMPSW
jgi:TrmH family RNA methyltransferase